MRMTGMRFSEVFYRAQATIRAFLVCTATAGLVSLLITIWFPTPDTRLQDITQLYLNPPPVAIPEEVIEEVIEAALEAAAEEEPAVSMPSGIPTTGGISFMQDSELDNPVEKEPVQATIEETTITEVFVDGEVIEGTIEVEKTDIEVIIQT
jgi:hypothetical protein